MHERARRMILERKKSNKTNYDKNANPLKLEVNDLVLLRKDVKKHKFDNKYDGPFRVEKIISPSVSVIRAGRKSHIVHNDKLKLATADYGNETPPKI